jgi:hypothetical protein
MLVTPAVQEAWTGRLQYRSALGKHERPHLKNNQSTKGWGCGLSGRTPNMYTPFLQIHTLFSEHLCPQTLSYVPYSQSVLRIIQSYVIAFFCFTLDTRTSETGELLAVCKTLFGIRVRHQG